MLTVPCFTWFPANSEQCKTDFPILKLPEPNISEKNHIPEDHTGPRNKKQLNTSNTPDTQAFCENPKDFTHQVSGSRNPNCTTRCYNKTTPAQRPHLEKVGIDDSVVMKLSCSCRGFSLSFSCDAFSLRSCAEADVHVDSIQRCGAL